jgi:hypothetical protein
VDRVKRSAEYPLQSPDLTSLDFYLCGDPKNNMCTKKPRSLQDLRHKIEIASVAIPPAMKQQVNNCHFYFLRNR